MKKITADALAVPRMSEQDKKNFAEWVWQMLHLNLFDMDVIGYPRTIMLRAQADEDPILYCPLQSVLMFESLAPKPGLSPRQEALALWRFGELVDKLALESGHREVYFMCADDRVADICARHGFQEVRGVRLLKKKIVEQPPDKPAKPE